MGLIASLTQFSNGGLSDAPAVNANYTAIRDAFNSFAVLTDTAKVISVTHVWSAAQTWSVAQSFPGVTSTSGLTVSVGTATLGRTDVTGAQAILVMNETDQSLNNKKWRFYAESAVLSLQLWDDAETTTGNVLSATRTGTTATGLTVYPATTFSSSVTSTTLIASSTAPYVRWYESDGAVDGKFWSVKVDGGVWTLRVDNDADNTTASILTATRSGMAISSVVFTPTVNLTGGYVASAACSIAGTLTVSSGGITVTGNSTITGTLGGITGLTVASGGLTVTAGGLTVSAGTTAVQALTATTMVASSTVTTSGLTLSATSGKIIPGATSLLIRDTADAATNLTITNAGNITTRAATITTITGDLVVSGQTTVANFPFCAIIPTISQTVTAGSPVLCSTEESDTSAMHDIVTNTGRITIPAGMGGTYVLIGSFTVQSGPVNFQWKINNTTSFGDFALGTAPARMYVHAIRILAAGDYVELRNGAGTTSTLGSAGGDEHMMYAYRIF